MLGKSLLKISYVGAGNILNGVLGLAFLAAVAKILDLQTFGKYALITALLVSLSRIIDFGTNSVFVAKSISAQSDKFINAFYTTKLFLLILSFPIIITVLFLLKLADPLIILIVILGLIAYAVNYTLYSLFQKDEKYSYLVLLNSFPAVIKGIFAALIFFKVFYPTLIQASAVFSFSLFACLPLIFLLPKHLRSFKLVPKEVFGLIKEAFPAGISQQIYETWPSISNAIAKISGGFSDVGIFALASKLSHIFVLISFSIFTVLLPKNANRKKQKLSYDYSETIMISILILLFCVLAIPAGHFILGKAFGEKFEGSIAILNILLFSNALTSIHTFIENFFYIESKTKYIMYINIGKLGVFTIACLALVSKLGIYGLAMADLIAAFLAVVFTALIIYRSNARTAPGNLPL